MTPLFFGARERRLLGIYEPAARSRQSRRAAVLCPSLGLEYTYAHRALRLLAGRLATAGFHTLRFDYYGTGDSAGDFLEGGVAGLETDIESAAEELGAIADTASTALIGLRLGATLATNVAARSRNTNALVLWDPVVSGETYLRDKVPIAFAQKTAAATTEVRRFDLEGCLVVDAFLDELQAVELTSGLAATTCRRLALFTNPPLVPPALQPLAENPGVTCEALASPAPWTEHVSSAGLVPVAAIQRIVEWLA